MRALHLPRLVALTGATLFISACADNLTEPDSGNGRSPISLVIVSGDGQTGAPFQELPQPVKVQATDQSNQPVPNVVVNFVVTAGGGSVFAGSALTDQNGYAADVWRLGAAGPQSLEVRAVDANGTKHVYGVFTATASNSTPTNIVKVAGDNQSAAVGANVAVNPAVKVTDQFNNPVVGETVTFTIGTGGGQVTGATAQTDNQGVATVGSWQLGPSAGSNTLTATAASLSGSPVTFSATGVSGTGLMAFATVPSTSAFNTIDLAAQPVVQLLDGAGFPVAIGGVTITASVVSGATATGNVTAVTDGTGKATFSGLSITGVVGSYQLSFSATGYTSLTSAPISLAAGPATSIAMVGGDAQSVNAGNDVPTAPSVRVTDQSGNPVPNVTVTFTPTLGGGSVLGGSATTGSNGVAQVTSWTLGPLSGPNTLTATVNGVASPIIFGATALGNFWSNKATMPTVRRYTSSVVVNGLVYVIGGRDAGGNPMKTVQAYDPVSNTWSNKANLLTARVGAMTGAVNGIIYVAGGAIGSGSGTSVIATVEAYDPGANTWTTKASMPEARNFAAAGSINGLFYVAGGGTNAPARTLATTYAYDPTSNTWTQKASLPAARGDLAGAVVNGKLYAVGGTTTAIDGAMQVYDPVANSWTTLPSMNTPRSHVNAESGNGLVYSISGQSAGSTNASTVVEAFDPQTNTWTNKASMLITRYGSGTGFVSGLVYVAAGFNGSANVNTTEKYVP